MRIQHNITAMNAYRNYNANNSALGKNLEKLSSGYKINRAGDDAAGLAISEKMRAQITGLDVAQKNAQDGISLVQTAEGALTEVHDMLNRMVELATQSANGTYEDDVDRENLQAEVDELLDEIDRISETANFNGINLLDGSLKNGYGADVNFGTTKLTVGASDTGLSIAMNAKASVSAGDIQVSLTAGGVTINLGSKAAASYTAAQIEEAVRAEARKQVAAGNATVGSKFTSFTISGGDISLAANDSTQMTSTALGTLDASATGLKLQIGDSSDSSNQLQVQIDAMDTAGLGINGLDIGDPDSANAAIDKIKTAINTVSSTRGTLGATQNRLEHTINNLSVMEENIQNAESAIRDTDVAEEMMAYTKNNILVQSAQAMLAQANQVPQGVLQLLQ